MALSFLEILWFALLPVLTILVGGIIPFIQVPGPVFRNVMLHFAAGVVFSVVAVELLPDIVEKHRPIEVMIGFGLGVAVMLAVKHFTGKMESAAQSRTILPWGILIGTGVDILLDGFLLGIGFAAGAKEGVLLALALSLEVFSLGIAISTELRTKQFSRAKTLSIVLFMGALFLVGTVLGATLLSGMSQEMTELVLSFGLAALLYLVTEELLMEAHEEKESPLITSAFFVGFLFFLILGMVA
jgi:ZIP family zinc transporter